MTALLVPQPFDSSILGGPVFRLAAGADLPAALASPEFATAHLVVARIATDAATEAARLEAAGFRAIERLLTFELDLAAALPNWPADVRLAKPADHAVCATIGRTAFCFDRYHADTRLDPAIGDRIKEAWVLNDLTGRADACLVAVADGTVVGFNLCLLAGDIATIDLVAVAAGHQGRGIGRRLTEAGARHYAGHARSYRAGTQANNAASVALYRRLGFRVAAEAMTYHWMPDNMRARI